MSQATLTQDSVEQPALYMALDVGNDSWVAAFAVDLRNKPRVRVIKATADQTKQAILLVELAAARTLLGLSDGAVVHSCYEAGAEGFWLHRWLEGQGVRNVVVHPASLAVTRVGKQAKTDRIDALALVAHLVRDCRGESCEPMRKVEVPPAEIEDVRAFTRGLDALHRQETQLSNRLQSTLRGQGIDEAFDDRLKERLPRLITGDGRPLGRWLLAELVQLCDQLAWIRAAIADREKERMRMVAQPKTELEEKIKQLAMLCGIGPVAATVLVYEMFGWRQFKNGKKVGSFLGLSPTPFASGSIQRDQGISKAGPGALRALMVQLAWAWLRYQPDSDLSKWYQARFGGTAKRSKRVGIIAVARKLAVLLWKYTAFGEVAPGAVEKSTKQVAQMRAVKPKRRRTGFRPSKPATVAAA